MQYYLQKVALVTGAASGMGREIARQLAEAGATVIVTDINLAGAETVARTIERQGGRADAFKLDVSDYHSVRYLVRHVAEQYGSLDFAFCNAGIGLSGEMRDTSIEQWERVLSVNLHGVIYTATEAYKIMLRQGSGHIVTTASLFGLTYPPQAIPYATAKHGVVAFSRGLRMEGEALGVRVTTFCPGFVDTNIFNAATYTSSTQEQAMSVIPFRPIPATEAVRGLLRGVAANRGMVVLPFHSRLMSWLTRYAHPLMHTFMKRNQQRLRTFRNEPVSEMKELV